VVAILSQYCINVTDLERAIAFWEGVIGIPVQSRTEIPNAREAVLQSPAGGSRMQLAQHLDHEGPIDMGSAMWKLYVNTDDCAALYDKTRGVPRRHAPWRPRPKAVGRLTGHARRRGAVA